MALIVLGLFLLLHVLAAVTLEARVVVSALCCDVSNILYFLCTHNLPNLLFTRTLAIKS